MDLLKTIKEASASKKRAAILIGALLLLAVIVIVTVVATNSKTTESSENESKKNETTKDEPLYGNPWDDSRLRKDIKPKHYDITFYIDVTEKKFWGKETIEVDITAPNISTIILHVNDIEIPKSSSFLRFYYKTPSAGNTEHKIEIKQHLAFPKNHYHVIYLKDYLIPKEGENYFLDVDWKGVLKHKFKGLYLSDYEENGVKRQTVSSQFQPISAREALPCFDEPEFKATFDMTIVAEQNYSYVSWNTNQVGKAEKYTEKGRDWKKVKFERSPIMSSYLLAFAVANFECVSKNMTSSIATDKTILLRVCGRPTLIEENYGDYALKEGERIMKYFETYYNQPYPLSKCDQVEVPDFEAGAMENWGLIFYRQEYLFFNEKKDPTSSKGLVSLVVAHELAHMWFGNLVTMKWWNDIWLNEGFATYLEGLGTKDSKGYTNDEFLISDWRVWAMTQDSYASSRAASVIVTDAGNINYLFDAIAYTKGASLLRQLRMVMDHNDGDNSKDKSFQDGLRDYLEENKYSNADQSQLYKALDKSFTSKAASGLTVDQVMKTWTLQMNFPVVTVDQYDKENLILSQRRFLIADESQGEGSEPSPYGYQWYVPIKYKTQKGNDEPVDSNLQWIRPNGHLVTKFAEDSIFVNWRGSGFFVTSYSLNLWEKLTANLEALKLSSGEKQVLLYDTYLLVNAGYYPLSRELQLLTVYSKSKDYYALNEAFRQIDKISSLIKMDTTLLQTWTAKWSDIAVKQYDDAQKLADGYENKLMKSLTMSLCLSYSDNKDSSIKCVSAATKMWNDKKDNGVEVGPDYKQAVYSFAAKLSPAEWDKVWEMYVNPTSTATEQDLLSLALAQTADEATIRKYIGYCMDSKKVRISNGLAIMGRYIARANSVSAKVSIDYMINNWLTIYEYFKTLEMECPAYVKIVISQITSEDDLRKVKEKFEDPKSGYMNDIIKVDYKSGVDTATGNIEWLKKNKDILSQ